MESAAISVVSLRSRLPVSHPDLEARALEERVWAHDASLISNLDESQRRYVSGEEDAIVLGAVYKMTKEQMEWYYRFEPINFSEYSTQWSKWAHDAVYFKAQKLGRKLFVEEENEAIRESMVIERHRAFWVLRHTDKIVYVEKHSKPSKEPEGSGGSGGSEGGGSGASARLKKAG